MSSQFIYPKPRDWEAFEDIVSDVLARKLNSPNMQRYGRKGQKQSGVDIVGYTREGLVGIQCKHHAIKNLDASEIDGEIKKSEEFRPKLDKLLIATSADRDTTAHNHTLTISGLRASEGKYPVEIMFWDDIFNWLLDFPDLVYKHFTRHFPTEESENIYLIENYLRPLATLQWPTTQQDLTRAVAKTLEELEVIDPYRLAIGFCSFPSVSSKGRVDVEIKLDHLLTNEQDTISTFAEVADILTSLRFEIGTPFFSPELLVFLQTRITLAYLFGWIFRRVTHHSLMLVFHDQVWTTKNLLYMPSLLRDGLPMLQNVGSEEVVVVLNISRDIESSVKKQVSTWELEPRAILSYHLDGYRVKSAAHASTLALEISHKMKNMMDHWGVKKIHLFSVLPAALATLIAYHLNAICPIALYYMSEERNGYKLGGILTNDL